MTTVEVVSMHEPAQASEQEVITVDDDEDAEKKVA
jgi:hypothetical protein